MKVCCFRNMNTERTKGKDEGEGGSKAPTAGVD